jgi:hypothetical protein
VAEFGRLISGPDQRMKDPDTLAFIHRMEKKFPEAIGHRATLRFLKSDFTFARPTSDGGYEALISFNAGIASSLGITGNVVALYLPTTEIYDTVIRRLQNALFDRAVEEHLFLLFSRDRRQEQKLMDWTLKQNVTVVSLPEPERPEDQAKQLFTNLQRALSARNAYPVTGAVTGDNFFGRGKTILNLSRDLTDGYVTGVFGLRKAGKTSIVKEIIRRYEAASSDQTPTISIFHDLEQLPGDPLAKIPSLCGSLAQRMRSEFKVHGIRTHELSLIVDTKGHPTPSDLSNALHASLSSPGAQDARIVLGLDEIETLVPPHESEGPQLPEVPEFLGALRSLTQAYPSFKVVIAGITAAPFRRDVLYGRENPLFSWAKPFYVPPLLPDEAELMITSLGRRMAVGWTSGALQELHAVTGGHAFLQRHLAGHVVQVVLDDDQTPTQAHTIDASAVATNLRPWKRDVAEIVDGMLRALDRYYPEGWEALNLIADGEDIQGVEAMDPSAIALLISLGVLTEDRTGVFVSPWARLSTLLG